MSDTLTKAVEMINERMGGGGFDGSVKFDIEGEGCILVNESGASVSDDEADCTISASADTFQEILDGSVNPTMAFMTGKLKLDGDMGTAMKLGSILG